MKCPENCACEKCFTVEDNCLSEYIPEEMRGYKILRNGQPYGAMKAKNYDEAKAQLKELLNDLEFQEFLNQ